MDVKEIEFLRKKNYQFIKEIGQGGFGKTVLLKDDVIDSYFVCKKYSPYFTDDKITHFQNFVNEIKLLYLMQHTNIVRIFTYYLYPESTTGYILMEYIKGKSIDKYIKEFPENINEIFAQIIDGFTYLENANILHRDIRPMNFLVNDDGIAKIIDFGFGKRIIFEQDYDKSISLNWLYEKPNEFNDHKYDFKTEVYFIGKLFEQLVNENNIEQFKYKSVLGQMIVTDPARRLSSFLETQRKILDAQNAIINFDSSEKMVYREFANGLLKICLKFNDGVEYITDISIILNKLEDVHKKSMLEENLENNSALVQCFIKGSFYYDKKIKLSISLIEKFIGLLKRNPREKQNIILNNLHNRLDTIERYSDVKGDDIPF